MKPQSTNSEPGKEGPDTLKLEIVETALEMIDEFGGVTPEDLLDRFPDSQETVDAALRALGVYETRMVQDRRQGTAGTSDELLKPGAVVGDYQIECILGHGAMGIVYRARQRSLAERVVALKVLPPALVAQDPRFLERFRREAALAAEIHDANVAEVYGFGQEDGLVFFAMQLIDGRSMGDVMKSLIVRRRLGDNVHESPAYIRQIVVLMREVARAVMALHARGLVHRDVKPSNVILAESSENDLEALNTKPVLIDFGLLRPVLESDLTGSQTMLGTPAYASPEAKLGRDVDKRADVFALGATLYAFLSLTSADSREATKDDTHHVNVTNPAVDNRLDAIVRMALEHRRELRYEDAGALLEDLDRYLANEPVRALPETAVGRVRLWTRRNPERSSLWLVGIALAVVLFGVSSFVAGAWAYPLYRDAGRGLELEEQGDLLHARELLRPLAESRWAGMLPFTSTARASAERYWGETSGFREPLDDLEAGLIRNAHVALQRLFWTSYPGEDADLLLRLFNREIQDPEDHQERSLRAIESVAHLGLDPNPHPHTDFPEGSPERQLFETLIRIATSHDTTNPVDPYVLQNVVAALGSTRTLQAFEVILPLLSSSDLELQRIGLVATERLWWDLRGPAKDADPVHHPALLQYDEALWVAWASQVGQAAGSLTTNPSLHMKLLSTAIMRASKCLAWTRMELHDADKYHDSAWSSLPSGFMDYLADVETIFTDSANGIVYTRENFVCIPPVASDCASEWKRLFSPGNESWSALLAPASDYQYPSGTTGDRQSFEVSNLAVAVEPFSSVSFKADQNPDHQINFGGATQTFAWTGLVVTNGGWGTHLILAGIDEEAVIKCAPPNQGGLQARIRIHGQTPAIWPLPHTGGGIIRISVNNGEVVFDRHGYAGDDKIEVVVPEMAVAMNDEFEVRISMATNSKVWIHEIHIEFEEIPQPAEK